MHPLCFKKNKLNSEGFVVLFIMADGRQIYVLKQISSLIVF